MFKVLLIVYIVGGGGSESVKDEWNTNFVFQEFHSVADCETVIEKMEKMEEPWHRGKKEKNDLINAYYSAECVKMTTHIQPAVVLPDRDDNDPPPLIVEPTNIREHSRWDD